MKQFLKDFEAFAVKGNAVDLAVGVVVGSAFTAITTALANNVITPAIGVYTGGVDFAKLAVRLPNGASIGYGVLIQAVVNFILIALVLFLFVRALGMLAAKKKSDEKKPSENPELKVLMEIRDELRAKRP
ncbi:MAG: large conductance mechanosensitive channel protein MscL [Patescibacteria group bacterium]|nr:large conductance mechanosensitive channel protein MscL [Patescibacteria group bacterium]MDE1944141.1 large conductance mechanosensitive channel protein MscL [Patescibacteria group bacterium]MDE1944762.1 large conductance mechanosensitive channel protein MscL [Patescibacteria group bacterium]MDE2058015.1 large conductance mechanosensitive channel protein MscL [Patescibacteria group bacterium]